MFHLCNGFRGLILTWPDPNPECPRPLTWNLGYSFQIAELYKSGCAVIRLAIVPAVLITVMNTRLSSPCQQ
jgi:hypothetical protein